MIALRNNLRPVCAPNVFLLLRLDLSLRVFPSSLHLGARIENSEAIRRPFLIRYSNQEKGNEQRRISVLSSVFSSQQKKKRRTDS